MNEQLEKLMNRAIDGELSEDDELSLNRELIRNPEARQLMAAYRAVDELSAAALHEVTAGAPPALDSMKWTNADSSKRHVRHGRSWFWLIPGAIAAALLAMIVPRPSPMNSDRPSIIGGPSAPTLDSVWGSRFADGQQDLLHSVRSTPAIHRDTGREIIGVIGDDGNLYWIEVERTRTVKLPANVNSRASRLNRL